MQLAERRTSAEQLSVLEDHDRIARDLHDLAIQRLFVTGMTLQSALRFVDRPERTERLGGRFEAAAWPDGGTRTVWRVPLQPGTPGPTG